MSKPTRPIQVKRHNEIPLSDGIVLSAMTWMPNDARQHPVPAILEYLPYRKDDQTAKRDALNHPYFASCGYACVRVDMRGTGDSQGDLLGEYLKQEQDDALQVTSWISNQPWCTGSVGMIGISWGGFNGLQVAARQPPNLKAVISICSTDDRYAGDIHYMGGCMLVDNLTWGASMFAIQPTPPDPSIVGDKWKDMWLQRLETGGTYVNEWHQKQRRDEFWDHASICRDYDAVKCPIYLVGGWQDPYHSSIFRMLKNLRCPKKGLIGPWGHLYPNFAEPHPQIGFLQESVRWWDKWLKGIENGIMDEPELRCYSQDTVSPQKHYRFRPGHWVAEKSWERPSTSSHDLWLAPNKLVAGLPVNSCQLTISSPQTVGFAAGKWLQFGTGPEGPGDQRLESSGSLFFDSVALDHPLHLLGQPNVHLLVSSNKPNAIIAATLSEVLPSGAATRLSYGVLNLTHPKSDREPTYLIPGQYYEISVRLNELGQCISPGSRLRLALSTSYFPIIWPSPETATLTIDCKQSRLELPVRPPSPLDASLKPFEPAVCAPDLATQQLREPKETNTITNNLDTGITTALYDLDSGCYKNLDTQWCYGVHEVVRCSIHPDDPLSARVEQRFRKEYGHKTPGLVIEGFMNMKATLTHWCIDANIEATAEGEKIFGRAYDFKIPRDHV